MYGGKPYFVYRALTFSDTPGLYRGVHKVLLVTFDYCRLTYYVMYRMCYWRWHLEGQGRQMHLCEMCLSHTVPVGTWRTHFTYFFFSCLNRASIYQKHFLLFQLMHNRLICRHNIDYVYTDEYRKIIIVVLTKHRTAPWWWFLREPKHVGARIIILNCLNISMIL